MSNEACIVDKQLHTRSGELTRTGKLYLLIEPETQAHFYRAGVFASARIAFPDVIQSGDAIMTASIQNSWSAFKVLKNGLKWFREATDETPEYRVWMLETLVDSVQKCLASLEAQIRFYQSAKGVGRAYWVVQPDGTEEHVRGQQLQTLVLDLPGEAHDAVIHGKPEALAAVAAALADKGHSTHGPANLHDIAAARGEAAFHGDTAPPTGGKPHGKPD